MFKSDKKGDKMEAFFYSTLSYDRDKKNEREYWVQDGEPADADLLHMVMLCSWLAAIFLMARTGAAPIPYQVWTRMYWMMMVVSFTGGAAGVSTEDKGETWSIIEVKGAGIMPAPLSLN